MTKCSIKTVSLVLENLHPYQSCQRDPLISIRIFVVRELGICTPGFLFQPGLQKENERAITDFGFKFGQKHLAR